MPNGRKTLLKKCLVKSSPEIYHFIGGVSKRQSKGRLPPLANNLFPTI